MLQVGLLEITAYGGFVRLLVHQIAVNLHLEICVLCFRALELEFRVKRVSLHRWVTQFHNDGLWLNDSPATQYTALHSPARLRRDPAHVFVNTRPHPTHF